MCNKPFNMDVNQPKLLPCGHSFCLFCLTTQENQTQNLGISIECPYCQVKYTHVPAANYETNYEIVQVLEKVQNTLHAGNYSAMTPNKSYYSPFKTPNRSSLLGVLP
jgi:hypothetical protein